MTKLDLKINQLDILLGMKLDTTKLKTHKIKKLGLSTELFFGFKKEPGQTIFWAKNCDIQCFGDKFTLFPNLDASDGPDMMYGTSAYLTYKDNLLNKVTFQLIENEFAANWIVNKFYKSATEIFGQPTTNDGWTIWSNTDCDVIIEKPILSKHAYFHWISK